MGRCLAGALVVSLCSSVSADDVVMPAEIIGEAPPPAAPAASPLEAGIYLGGFISNYFHQFYDIDVQPNRQELERVNMELGVRIAYFFHPMVGAEVEGGWVRATTKQTSDGAAILNVRAQAIVQKRFGQLAPFGSLGLGIWRVSSDDDILGSDTDMLLQAGVGARFFVTEAIALRGEFRYLRGPSQQEPYHLNAGYAEFMVGVSFVPTFGGASEPEPPKVVVVEPPKVDTDGDGVTDDVDSCASEAEDKDLFDDTDGCPDPDNDKDGIPDVSDKCSMDAEDKDGYQDDDGCVDRDNDNDGVADAQDACAAEPEDRDGYRDGDGCPDPDNDKDGIPDTADTKCPNDAEVINGVDDDDGCPDRGDALVVLSTDRLEMLAPVTFDKGKLSKDSLNVLAQVAGMLRQHSQILRLRITVHVQPTNNPDADQANSDKRGAAIRDWLVTEKGIEKKRLEVRGFGGSKPLVPKKAKSAALINDRIELIILERN